MVTEDFAVDIDRRLHGLYDKGVADFGSERVAELIAIGQASEQPDEASDTRSLRELVWWRDVVDVVLQASPPVIDWMTRVDAAMTDRGITNPDQLPAEIRGQLEEEGLHVQLIRQAAGNFGFEL
jgi:hypothetical protein